MTESKLQNALLIGENIVTEFKRCDGGINTDTYKSVCSFLNRFGGDIYLGVDDNRTVKGIHQNAISDMIKNFIQMVSNPELLSPTVYLAPEIINYKNKK